MVENLIELPEALTNQINELAEEGSRLFDEKLVEPAIEQWCNALALIPEPHNYYSKAVWLDMSIGDAYFSLGDYEKAEQYLRQAKNNVDFLGCSNPFVMLRYGQVLFELGDIEQAKDYLLRAYGLDDDGDLFSEDDPKYLTFLKEQVNG